MIEIFKDTKYDFIGKKKFFITFSLILSVLCIVAFAVRGFNMGIDFAGGTIVTVRFKNPHDDSRLRTALSKEGIDTTKVIIQPISGQIGETPKNDVLIRLPQTVASENVAGGIDADKRKVIDALAKNYSSIDAATIQGKQDVNNSNAQGIKAVLVAKAPLGASPEADKEYDRLAKHVVEYRDTQRGGIIPDVAEIPLGGFDPKFSDALKNNFYSGDFNIVDASVVGPQVGRELRNRAIYVTLAALGGMLVFIAFRFEWIYGFGAVIATFHDVMLTLGIFSLFGWEISLNVIAALLTLIGYSMNDTIVIFDRIREDLKLKRRESMESVSNTAINETLSRTIITSGLTFLSVLALVVFGGQVLRGFSLTLFIGILVGTYSSIFIATPVLLWWKDYVMSREGAKRPATPAEKDGKSSSKEGKPSKAKA